MKAGSYARWLLETDFLSYSPNAKTSAAATRHYRIANLPDALAAVPPTVLSMVRIRGQALVRSSSYRGLRALARSCKILA
jgi:hypothetical protein